MSAHLVGAGEAIMAVQHAVAGHARRDGKRAALPRLLTRQAWNAIVLADWTAARSAAEEAAGLAEELCQPLWQAAALCGQAMIAGTRGDAQAAGQLAQRAEAIALPARAAPVLCSIQLVRGVTAIGAGRYDEAFDHLGRVFDRADPSYQATRSGWALGDFAESAVRTARTDEARKILDAFRPGERDSVAPWAGVALCYAEALLADDDVAEAAFGRALELRASGETSEAPDAGPGMPLSPQELQIARLAAEGLSNREIGQQLYLSHRTVGSHLYRMFPKLGITSRGQLRPLLGAGEASR
jgi:DNA-binding NarL/FixJ family response regulator